MTFDRRTFLGMGTAAVAALSAPAVLGQGKPRVIVVGGGAGGATAARYLAKDSNGAIDVRLIEPTKEGWYRRPGSNGGPLDPQSSALTN